MALSKITRELTLFAHKPINRQGGFTLIEALIAFVILSIGLLGIVSLQTVAKTSQHQAIQRTRAVALADGMIERIRINPGTIATYIASNPLGGGSIAAEPVPNCISASCTPTQLAAHDLWAWEQVLDGAAVTAGGANTAGLINPRGCVFFTASPTRAQTGLLSVAVQWRGLKATTDGVQAGDRVCGGAAAGADNFRRRVIVNTYVIDEDEL